MKSMRALVGLLLALAVLAVIHEGIHALIAMAYGEYGSLHVHPFGLEVEYNTAVAERLGFKWALISGASNLSTCSLAYLLLLHAPRLSRIHSAISRSLVYWLSLLGLLLDPLNLSIGPSIYGGDGIGVAEGLGVGVPVIQVVFAGLFLFNRELAAQRLLPSYGVETRHPLLRPLIQLKWARWGITCHQAKEDSQRD